MEARLSHLYLPTLADDANVQEPTDLGLWQNNERRVLGQVARSIVIDEQARVRGVSSVPDVWARPLTMQSALRADSHHPLRDRLVPTDGSGRSRHAANAAAPSVAGQMSKTRRPAR